MHDDPEGPSQGRRAPFLRRLVAFLIDGLAIAVVGFAVLALATVVLGPTVRLRLDVPEAPVADVLGWRVIVNSLLLSAVSAGYFVACWSRFGFTPGQGLLGLTVVSRRPNPGPGLAVRTSVLRWALLGAPLGLAAAVTVQLPLLFVVVSAISAIWFATLVVTTLVGRSGRGLHDRLSGTMVIGSD
jgi:uncharacterized RDD family membrane protein YckC